MPQPTPQYGHVVSTCRAIGAGASFGRSAPVGQVATHWPHEVQIDDAMGPSPNTPTRVAWPRPTSEMAPMCWTSPQATVQRPQRMHASRSSTKNDLVSSTGNRWSGGVTSGAARPCWRRRRADLAEAVAARRPGVSIEQREVEHGPAHAHRVRVLGAHDHAVARGQVAGGGEAALPFDVDQAGAAGAERRRGPDPCRAGQRDPEPVDGVQHRGALGQLDLAVRRR